MTQKNDDSARISFGHFVDRMFWSLLTVAALYLASQIKDATDKVSDLTTRMAVVESKLRCD